MSHILFWCDSFEGQSLCIRVKKHFFFKICALLYRYIFKNGKSVNLTEVFWHIDSQTPEGQQAQHCPLLGQWAISGPPEWVHTAPNQDPWFIKALFENSTCKILFWGSVEMALKITSFIPNFHQIKKRNMSYTNYLYLPPTKLACLLIVSHQRLREGKLLEQTP